MPQTGVTAADAVQKAMPAEELRARMQAFEHAVDITIATRTLSGTPIQTTRGHISDIALDDVRPRPQDVTAAVSRLESLGFTVLRVGRFGITARGPARLVAEVIEQPLRVFARTAPSAERSVANFGVAAETERADLFVAPSESLSVPVRISEHIDHVVFTPPPIYFAASATAPSPGFAHVDHAALRRLLNTPDGADGAGATVAMIDTGFADHPAYPSGRFDVRRIAHPSTPDPENDTFGHGTAILWSLLNVAPAATVLALKQTAAPQDALELAADRGANVINCSWGWDREQTFPILEATIRSIVEQDGAAIVCAAGNGQYAWPASMRSVIAAGGVFADANGALEASNYASGFVSSQYPGRRVPDVSGLCGQGPLGIYLPLPCPPDSTMDRMYAGPAYPDRDETTASDGWVIASGTSSAAAQITGVLALCLVEAAGKGVQLSPARMREILEQTARPVTSGRNAFGVPAAGHPNVACGYGLVDAAAALGRV